MEMVTEGYYGAKCIHELNSRFRVNMPIAWTVYQVLYEKLPPQTAINKLIEFF